MSTVIYFCVCKTTRGLKIFILQWVNSQTFIMETSQMTNTHTNQCKAALTRRIIQTTCLGLSKTDANQIQMCFHQYGGCGELIMKWNWSGKLVCKPVFFPVSWDPALFVRTHSLARVCVCVLWCVYVTSEKRPLKFHGRPACVRVLSTESVCLCEAIIKWLSS